MVIYWGGCFPVFFEPLSKCSWEISNVFLITFHPVTFVPMYDSTFLLDGILIFWSHQEILDGIASFKVDLHSMFTECYLYTLFSTHAGYLHLVSACFKCSSSCHNSLGLEQMVWTVWWSEPTILYLDDTAWLLSHCRYRSVCAIPICSGHSICHLAIASTINIMCCNIQLYGLTSSTTSNGNICHLWTIWGHNIFFTGYNIYHISYGK